MRIPDILNPLYVYERRRRITPYLQWKTSIFVSNCKKKSEEITHRAHLWLNGHGIAVTANERKVADLKNIHRGRRCFIIGNGPSLNIEDLPRLKNEVTFACNKIYLAFDKTEWRPTYYSILDVLVAENNSKVVNKLNLCKIFHEDVRPWFDGADDIIWLKGLAEPLIDGEYQGRFSANPLDGVCGGWSVIFPQIQIAYYMGIREIYLIGVDFSFDVPKPSGKKCIYGDVLEHQGENNHFHPEYRKPGETWSIPSLDLQYKAFVAAKQTVEANGGRIFNASRKTALDVFPCVDFDSITASK